MKFPYAIAMIKRKISRIIDKVYNRVFEINKKKYLSKLRKHNKNTNCSIICNNCVGGVICHNLNMRFNTPTINLFIRGKEYLEFCKHLEFYLACEIIESKDSMKDGYPVGIIVPKDDSYIPISIYFQHYKDFATAKAKWIERASRVDFSNIFFLWEFYDTAYDLSLAYEFDKLPVRKKIITHRKIDGLENQVCVSCYTDDKPIAKILQYKGLNGKQYLDDFDYVRFINS